MKTSTKSLNGFSLIELMVTMAVGFIIIGGTISMFATTVGSNTDVLKISRLEEELAAAMSLMVKDIRRSGFTPAAYNTNNLEDSTGWTNPFQTVTIADVDGNGDVDGDGTDDNGVANDFDCIIFSFDNDGNATFTDDSDSDGISDDGDGIVQTDELYGFRLNDGAVEMRSGGTACNGTGWQDMTDPDVIEITALTFSETPVTVAVGTGGTVSVRSITITLTGRLVGDTSVSRTVQDLVRVRNENYDPS